MKRLTINQRAFGLLEILITTTIAGIVLYGITLFFSLAFRSTRTLTATTDFSLLSADLSTIFQNKATCSTALWNSETPIKPARFSPTVNLPQMQQVKSIQAGPVVYAKAGRADNAFDVQAITLTELDATKRVVSGGTTKYLTQLAILARRSGNAYGSGELLQKNFTLWVTTDTNTTNTIPDHQILECDKQTETLPMASGAASGAVGADGRLIGGTLWSLKTTSSGTGTVNYTVPVGQTLVINSIYILDPTYYPGPITSVRCMINSITVAIRRIACSGVGETGYCTNPSLFTDGLKSPLYFESGSALSFVMSLTPSGGGGSFHAIGVLVTAADTEKTLSGPTAFSLMTTSSTGTNYSVPANKTLVIRSVMTSGSLCSINQTLVADPDFASQSLQTPLVLRSGQSINFSAQNYPGLPAGCYLYGTLYDAN